LRYPDRKVVHGPIRGTFTLVKKHRAKLIGRLWRNALLLAPLLLALSSWAQADGGLVQLHQAAGPFVVTVFAAPNPPRVGLLDVTVLAQDGADGRVALDVEVFVRLRSAGGTVVMGRATREASQNKSLYSASMNLPEAGRWEMEVTIKRGEIAASALGQLSVLAPAPLLLSYWRSLSLPWVIIILFALNQWLKGRAVSRGRETTWRRMPRARALKPSSKAPKVR
jgi:hypothetical protein